MTTVVIDKDILGWADEHLEDLSKSYEEVLKIGQIPALPQRNSDVQTASFCKINGCDLLTGDGTAYTHYFNAGITAVQISRYGWYAKADKPIYLIKIVE